MMETQNILNQFNENYDEDNRLSSRYGMVEYLTTMRYIEKYLQPRADFGEAPSSLPVQ